MSAGTLEERLQQPFWPLTPRFRAALAFAVLIGAALRSYRLTDLFPVLVDEAIYLRWAEIIQHDHTWFISLLDAKPPLAYWIYTAVRLAVPQDPLLGNRLISVAAGTLCVIAVYRVGFLCGGERAGIVTGLLYSLLPYGVLYDRIAYVDSLTNLSGALLIGATLSAFGLPTRSWKRTAVVGLTLGLALFTKTTILLLALAPAVIALSLRRASLRGVLVHLGVAYALAAIFPALTYFVVPDAPEPAVNNLLVHRSNFFTPLRVLANDPLFNVRFNGPLLVENAHRYITYVVLAATAGSVVALWTARERLAIVILTASILPFALPVAMLEYFPSRYAFPHTWPLLLAIGSASAVPLRRQWARTARWSALAIVVVGLAVQSGHLLHEPERALAPIDAAEFLGTSPFSGFGVLEAIDFLRAEGQHRPITILTDPQWGPPADVVFAYLNGAGGTHVYEAWWLELKGKYPLVPAGNMPVWKSHYERINAGEVDFSSVSPLYYITDTNYRTPGDVHGQSPGADLVRRFPKRGGMFIDVYRVN